MGGRRWTEQDERYLLTWWGLRTPASIAKVLGRTPIACDLKFRSLLPGGRYSAFMTANEVARTAGVSGTTVVHWIRQGWLKAERSVVPASPQGEPSFCWMVRPRWFRRFVTTQAFRLDWRRMEPGEFRDLVQRQTGAWVTIREAAHLLGLSHRECYYLMLQHDWERHRIEGGRWVVRRSDVESYRLKEAA